MRIVRVRLEPDVRRAVEILRREQGLGPSAALNALARIGIETRRREEQEIAQHTAAPVTGAQDVQVEAVELVAVDDLVDDD